MISFSSRVNYNPVLKSSARATLLMLLVSEVYYKITDIDRDNGLWVMA